MSMAVISRKSNMGGQNIHCSLTHCILGNFHAFLSSADFLKTILSEIPSECQTVWTQIRPSDPNCLPRSSADDTGRQRGNTSKKLLHFGAKEEAPRKKGKE